MTGQDRSCRNEAGQENVVVYIGLGSNLGDRRAMLQKAVQCLEEEDNLEVRKVSDWYATAPIGGPRGQAEYLNGVAEIATSLPPEVLLDRLLAVEQRLGRRRRQRWGPRCIDLDLLLYGQQVIKGEHLEVPHQLMHRREFVLRGLAEIAPEVKHPLLKRTAMQLWQKVIAENKGG